MAVVTLTLRIVIRTLGITVLEQSLTYTVTVPWHNHDEDFTECFTFHFYPSLGWRIATTSHGLLDMQS